MQLHSSNGGGGGASAAPSVALGAVGKDGTLVLADRVAGCLQLLQVCPLGGARLGYVTEVQAGGPHAHYGCTWK